MLKLKQLLLCWILVCIGCGVPSGNFSHPNPTAIPSVIIPTLTPMPMPPTPLGQTGNWNLIFSDDFDGTKLNINKWTKCYWWDNQGCTNEGNHEIEWYQPDNVLVENGLLRLRAQPKTIIASDGKAYQYTSGMITSGHSTDDLTKPVGFSFQYGYVEIRAKLPAGQGLWPAFWMLPDNNESKPEIDVMEVLGNAPDAVHMTFHYRATDGSEGQNGNTWVGSDFSAGWHTFAIDWQPNALVWYIDGIERWRYIDAATIPDKNMYLLLNLAVGGDWPGAPDNTTRFPSYYQIDYVRIWKH